MLITIYITHGGTHNELKQLYHSFIVRWLLFKMLLLHVIRHRSCIVLFFGHSPLHEYE